MSHAGMLSIGAQIIRATLEKGGTLEALVPVAMKSARSEIWWTIDEEELFRIAVAGLMTHFGKDSEEWRRMEHEIAALRYLNAGIVVGNLDRLGAHLENGPEPVGLMAAWRESANA